MYDVLFMFIIMSDFRCIISDFEFVLFIVVFLKYFCLYKFKIDIIWNKSKRWCLLLVMMYCLVFYFM